MEKEHRTLETKPRVSDDEWWKLTLPQKAITLWLGLSIIAMPLVAESPLWILGIATLNFLAAVLIYNVCVKNDN